MRQMSIGGIPSNSLFAKLLVLNSNACNKAPYVFSPSRLPSAGCLSPVLGSLISMRTFVGPAAFAEGNPLVRFGSEL